MKKLLILAVIAALAVGSTSVYADPYTGPQPDSTNPPIAQAAGL